MARKVMRREGSRMETAEQWRLGCKKFLASFGFDSFQIRENIQFPDLEKELVRIQFRDPTHRRLKYLIPWYMSGWFSGFTTTIWKREITFQVLRLPTINNPSCFIEGYSQAFHDNRSAKNFLQFTHSRMLRPILLKALEFAQTKEPILIVGEQGVGKEHFARYLHFKSSRRTKPFIHIDAEKTTMNDWINAISSASGGALYINKIYALPRIIMQVFIKELLQPGDVRLICSSSLSLDQMLQSKKISHEVFRQLMAHELRLPPLRSRPEDIIPLANKLLQQISFSSWRFSPAVLTEFVHYTWPRNVSEMQAVVNHMVLHNLYGNSELDLDLLPDSFQSEHTRTAEQPLPVGKSLHEIERMAILNTLKQVNGNKRKAADILNIGYNTLWRKLQLYREEQN